MATLFEQPKQTAIEHLRYHKTIGLAVSGDVKLTKLETEIIDTPDFQRLRSIQQLGSCSWVYPTAVHTRFDHSLGVLKMTDSMIAAINEGTEQVESKPGPPRYRVTNQQRILARLCALLHDVTHVPFGHTLEDELRIFGSHDEIDAGSQSDGKRRFDRLVGEQSAIGKLIIKHIERPMYDRLLDIIHFGRDRSLAVKDEDGETQDEFIYHLVSDTICSDLLDYIERDSFFCNLGISIHKRFLDYIFVTDVTLTDPSGQVGEPRRRVVVRLWKPRDETPRYDVMTDLVSVLDARYRLTERVYFHHTKITTAAMIARAAQEAKLLGALDSLKLLEFGDATFLDYLMNIDTRYPVGRTKQALQHVAVIQKLARAVSRRALYQRIKSYPREAFWMSANENCYDKLIEWFASASRRRDIENMLALAAGGDEGDVLVYVAAPSMNRKIARAVVDYGGARVLLEDVKEPTLKARLDNIKESHFRLWKVDILVDPTIEARKHDVIRWAFESHFSPAERAEEAFRLWLDHIAVQDGINEPHERISEACGLAAKSLIKGERAFGHSSNVLGILRQTLQEKLDGLV